MIRGEFQNKFWKETMSTSLLLDIRLLLLFSAFIPFIWASTSLSQHPSFVRGILNNATAPVGYQILEEKILYQRWRILHQRVVRMPSGKVVDFDVVGQKGSGAAIVFAWNSTSKTATLCREYNPGPHQVLSGLAAGLIENDKHDADPQTAAEHEMEEEIHLAGGTWYSLTKIPLAMDKYATTRIYAYLVIDPEPVTDPRPRDDEEEIQILSNVSVQEIERMIDEGEMNLVGSWASLLALNKLRQRAHG
jgi:hypothetical protein